MACFYERTQEQEVLVYPTPITHHLLSVSQAEAPHTIVVSGEQDDEAEFVSGALNLAPDEYVLTQQGQAEYRCDRRYARVPPVVNLGFITGLEWFMPPMLLASDHWRSLFRALLPVWFKILI